MVKDNLEQQKLKSVLLFILKQTKTTGFHELFKILYFAEKKHIAKYGSPILGDRFVAMKYGPVPSFIFDFLKKLFAMFRKGLFFYPNSKRIFIFWKRLLSNSISPTP